MRHLWTIIAVGALVLGIALVALLTRYEYHSVRGVVLTRVDRWTGRVQSWRCLDIDFSKYGGQRLVACNRYGWKNE